MKLTREQQAVTVSADTEHAPGAPDMIREVQDQLRERVRQNKVTDAWKEGQVQEINQRFLDTINELLTTAFALTPYFLVYAT